MTPKPIKPRASTSDHLAELSDLIQDSRKDPSRFFERGLALLVQAFEVDRALLTRVTGLGYEVFWWAMGPKATMTCIFEAPERGFCPFLLAHPERPLTIQDAEADPRWGKSSGYLELGIRSYAGVALKTGNDTLGTLCLQHSHPRAYTKAELSLLRTMGHFMAHMLEAENLKHELRMALEALELSSAILEDSALESPRSGLPNRRFLEVWLRASLYMARRRKEPMVLALWSQPMAPGIKGRLSAAASHLRGEDLLVELSTDQYLLLLPHTTRDGAEVLLARLRETLGDHPTGATLWVPDGKDMTLKSALRNVGKVFTEANREGLALVWDAH